VVLAEVLTDVGDTSAILRTEVDDDVVDEAVVDVMEPSTCWLNRSAARGRKTRRRAITSYTAKDASSSVQSDATRTNIEINRNWRSVVKSGGGASRAGSAEVNTAETKPHRFVHH
jgi:hypothetical protein